MTATSFIGNGAGLTGVNASMLGGIAVGLFAHRDTSNLFVGSQTVNGTVTATSFAGDGSGLTGVAATSAAFAVNAATFTISLPAISPGNCNTSSIAVGFPDATDGDTLALGIPNAMT